MLNNQVSRFELLNESRSLTTKLFSGDVMLAFGRQLIKCSGGSREGRDSP